nr:antiviral reverse transcriptase Drt3a [uncultured Flavobacterium sp.]
MLDQSFSGSNFNIIFLKENRKGNIKERHLNQAYFDKHDEFNIVLNEKIDLKKTRTLSIEELDSFAEKLEAINKAKEEIRNNLFSEYATIINNEKTPFCFEIKYDKQNQIYTTKKDGVHFFAIKQLQHNLSKTFKVIQADRNKIIKQTYNLISDGFPKIIIRTDIHKFYESIPQNILFEKLENSTLLSPLSKKLLKRLFFEFERIKDESIIQPKKGIPRGFGVSAYLSELYMREIDNEIESLPDIIYYARYVDDIIAVFSPKTKSQARNYQEELKKIIKKNQLEINDNLEGRKDKTLNIALHYDKSQNKNFIEPHSLTFLGYLFEFKHFPKAPKTQIKIKLSEQRVLRYTKRMKLSILAYNKDSKYNEGIARKLLFDRLKFLSGNYHLNHNKKNISAGIYYSNKMLELTGHDESMSELNEGLNDALNDLFAPAKMGMDMNNLKEFIKNKFCFEKGFSDKEKYFYSFKFSPKEQSYYNKKFKRVTNKFEVIKSIWKDE